MDNIPVNQIAYRKTVGKLDGDAIVELATKGGLHLIVRAKRGKTETLGAGAHRAISRFIAEKREPNIQWTELSKSEHIPVEHFQHLLPRWEAITDDLRRLK